MPERSSRYRHRRTGAAKRILVDQTGDIYPNARAAADELGLQFSNVYKCLRGEKEKHKGFSFHYVD